MNDNDKTIIRHMHDWGPRPSKELVLSCVCGERFDDLHGGDAVAAWAKHVADALANVSSCAVCDGPLEAHHSPAGFFVSHLCHPQDGHEAVVRAGFESVGSDRGADE